METRSKEYLLISDFDQTLSFNDSGIVLSELLGVAGFADRIQGLSRSTWCSRAPNWRICCCTIRSTGVFARSTWWRSENRSG